VREAVPVTLASVRGNTLHTARTTSRFVLLGLDPPAPLGICPAPPSQDGRWLDPSGGSGSAQRGGLMARCLWGHSGVKGGLTPFYKDLTKGAREGESVGTQGEAEG